MELGGILYPIVWMILSDGAVTMGMVKIYVNLLLSRKKCDFWDAIYSVYMVIH